MPMNSRRPGDGVRGTDRKSTRLNSSHGYISYAVFCLKKKNDVHTSTTVRPSNTADAHIYLACYSSDGTTQIRVLAARTTAPPHTHAARSLSLVHTIIN